MADLDEVLAIYDEALAEAHRRGSMLALAAVKVCLAEIHDTGRRFESVGSRNPAFIAWRTPAASPSTSSASRTRPGGS
jgi:hypothetical protein